MFRFVKNKRAGAGGLPFQVFYKNKDGCDRSQTVADLPAAARVLVADSLPDRSWSGLPVDALVEWIIDRVQNGRGDGTPGRGAGYVKNVRIRLRKHFLPVFAGKAVGEIDGPALSAFRLSLGERKPKLKPATVTGICHTVDMLFRECVETGIIAGPPPTEAAFAQMRRSFRPATVRHFEPDERAAMLATEEPDLLFVARCLFELALREDEIAALSLDDVGRTNVEIRRVRHLGGKMGPPGNTERLRSIRVDPGLERYFRMLAWKGLDRSLPILLQLVPPGTRMGNHQVRHRFEKLQKQAGVLDDLDEPKYTPLEARHTCIIDWLCKPHDLEQLTREAGMASPERLLETYSRWVFDPTDVETFDLADAELSAELASAERDADDAV